MVGITLPQIPVPGIYLTLYTYFETVLSGSAGKRVSDPHCATWGVKWLTDSTDNSTDTVMGAPDARVPAPKMTPAKNMTRSEISFILR